MQHVPILDQMVQKFKTKHGKLPTKITVTPIALALLSLRHSASVRCEGVPVESRLFDEQEVVPNGPNLGVFVYESGHTNKHELRACDLA
jgi:hypothetical protein